MSVTVAYVSRAFMVGVDAKQSEAASTQLVALFERGCIDNVSTPVFRHIQDARVRAHTRTRTRTHMRFGTHLYIPFYHVILTELSILVSD